MRKEKNMTFVPLSILSEFENSTDVIAMHTDLDTEKCEAQVRWLAEQLNTHSSSWLLDDLLRLLPCKAEITSGMQMLI